MENIHLSQLYSASAENLFEIIKTGTLFELTGANEIQFSFWEEGTFRLTFTNRGEMFGTFLQIIPNKKIVLDWNVNGFGMEPERKTQVIITLSGTSETTFTLDHTGITNSDSLAAKKKAWMEIMHDLKEKLALQEG